MSSGAERAVDWDVIVVGSGPAGSVAAAQCAARGLAVLLLEKKPFPRSKVCGCCVNRQAIDSLGRLGASATIRRTAMLPLSAWQVAMAGRTLRVSDRDFGACITRGELDSSLASHAISRGACFHDGTPAAIGECENEWRLVHVRTDREQATLRARVVIAACGLGVRLPVRVGPAVIVARRSRLGASAILNNPPDSFQCGTIYMACAPQGYVGLVRLPDDRLNLAAAMNPAHVHRHGVAGAAADILRKSGLPDVECMSLAWRGTSYLTATAQSPAADRLFLVGDAAGYVEPFTGDGIARAIDSGAAVAEFAVAACCGWHSRLIPAWAARLAEITRARTVRARLAAAMLRSRPATHLAFAAMRARPAIGRWIVDSFAAPMTVAGAVSR